jgi:hypothetical protein
VKVRRILTRKGVRWGVKRGIGVTGLGWLAAEVVGAGVFVAAVAGVASL